MGGSKKNSGKNKTINRLNIALSVLVAFSAWFYVVSEVTPTTVRTYNDIPIKCVGLDALSNRGLGVKDVSELETRIKVNMYRTDISETDESDFSATVDVSDAVKGDNTFDVKVTTPGRNTLKSQSVETVTVNVTESLNRDVPVTATYAESSDGSREPVLNYIDTEKVSIIGAKSQVEKVAYVALPVSMIVAGSDNEFERNTIGAPVAMTANGKSIDNIIIRPETVDIRYSAGSVKTVKLEVDIEGASENMNYIVPDTVSIKGASSDISEVEKIEASCNLRGATKGDIVEIQYKLPDEVYLANKSLSDGVTIK